jgi:hypothetical protein
LIELRATEVGHPLKYIELAKKLSKSGREQGKKFDVDPTGFSASVTHETHSASISLLSVYPTSNGQNRLSPNAQISMRRHFDDALYKISEYDFPSSSTISTE